MQDNNIEENYFWKNRKSEAVLFFKYWLKHEYFPRILSFTDTTVNSKIAATAYEKEFKAARKYAKMKHNRRAMKNFKLVKSKYKNVNKVSITINNYLNCVMMMRNVVANWWL